MYFYDIRNTALTIKEAFYEDFFVLNVTKLNSTNSFFDGISCTLLLISKNTPFYQFNVIIAANSDEIGSASVYSCSSVYINFSPFQIVPKQA